MKFNKNMKISLRAPRAKPVESLLETPKEAGQFAVTTTNWAHRGINFEPGDLLRISFNQRYVNHPGLMQVISCHHTCPLDRHYLGSQYLAPLGAFKITKTIPVGTQVRLICKEYPIPVETVLTVMEHKGDFITVKYQKKLFKINDSDIEGTPTNPQARRGHTTVYADGRPSGPRNIFEVLDDPYNSHSEYNDYPEDCEQEENGDY